MSTDAQDEAFDFTSMERKILKTIEHMTHKLADLKSGGAFNTSALESLQVQPDKQSQELMKLSDLAQVVIQGRHVKVILSDEAVSHNSDAVRSQF
jgi:ribosome recycling factor